MEDLFGRALLDFVKGKAEDMVTWTSVSPPEILRTAYFFRTWEEMPLYEQRALEMCAGKVLDVGAGSGCHALVLQERGVDVTALENSPAAMEVLAVRGVQKRVFAGFFDGNLQGQYDTLLFLMNGVGMVEKAGRLDLWFARTDALLAPGGRALVHLSDISYLYEVYGRPFPADDYYGDVDFYLKYKGMCESFPWTYVGVDIFSYFAEKNGFALRVCMETEKGDVLAEIWKK